MKAFLFFLFLTPLLAQEPTPPPAQPDPEPSVSLNFPRTTVVEILSTYETLTGKRTIRDSNLAGPELSIVVPNLIKKDEAIRLIESSLLLNGYSLIPVDANTVKILGPSRAPRGEGLPLFVDGATLPTSGDQVVSFYRPLAFVSPEDAIAVITGVLAINPFGTVVPVANTNAIIITDKTPLIRKALALLTLIDVEPAQVVTEFIPLQRASAERIVEILEEMFGKGEDNKNVAASGAPPDPNLPPGTQVTPAAATGARYENRLIAGKARFLADKRTNRILVVTRVENYRYVRDVIMELDAAGKFEQPYVRVMNYVPVGDVFPVLTDMLADAETELKASTGGAGAAPTPNTSQNNAGGQGSSQGGLGSGGLSRPDRLGNEAAEAAPLSATLGSIRLIADNSSNSIIVFGPPESKERTRQILELLDQRPKQVYLAVVIGQLRLGDSLDYGANYVLNYKGAESIGGIAAAALSGGILQGLTPLASPIALKRPGQFPTASGLTIYGSIADTVDVYARFLESTNRFRTLSRPVIYTTNNRKATILSGQKVPVPTSTLTTATGGGLNNQGTAVTSNIQYTDVVLKLEVIPLINSDHEVNLVIAQTNDNIVGFDTISGNQVPRIATQEITTSVRVPNGSTIVLGGLITEDKDENLEGVPYISRIPIVGPLLGGRKNNRNERRELIVMIQPMVVDSNEQMHKASASETDRSRLGQDAAAMTAPLAEQARPPAPWKPTPTPTPKPKKSWWFGSNEATR